MFKWVSDDYSDGTLLKDSAILSDLFFAKQVINNACATQALISILLNIKHSDLNIGGTLSEFKEFTRHFDSSMRGLALSNAELIRSVHNSFARQQMFEFDPLSNKKEKEDVFHFISYIPFGGRLIELDGLKEGPYDLGPITDATDWISTARPHIEKRMAKYATGEIHFNLMAVVSDRKMIYSKQIKELESKEVTEAVKLELSNLQMLISDEDSKMQRYKVRALLGFLNFLKFTLHLG